MERGKASLLALYGEQGAKDVARILGVIGITDLRPPTIENLLGIRIDPKLISEVVLESEQRVCRLQTNRSAVAR